MDFEIYTLAAHSYKYRVPIVWCYFFTFLGSRWTVLLNIQYDREGSWASFKPKGLSWQPRSPGGERGMGGEGAPLT
jgi:hypothetical protein